MTVYVDDVRHRFGRMIMCHLWADSLDELHAAAAAIGIARRWFQDPVTMPKVSWAHYDISLTMKAKALARGAVLTDKYGPVHWLAVREERWDTVEKVAMLRARWIDQAIHDLTR